MSKLSTLVELKKNYLKQQQYIIELEKQNEEMLTQLKTVCEICSETVDKKHCKNCGTGWILNKVENE